MDNTKHILSSCVRKTTGHLEKCSGCRVSATMVDALTVTKNERWVVITLCEYVMKKIQRNKNERERLIQAKKERRLKKGNFCRVRHKIETG